MRDHLDSGMKTNSNEYSKQVTLAPSKIVKICSITTEAAEADDALSPKLETKLMTKLSTRRKSCLLNYKLRHNQSDDTDMIKIPKISR
jgi:hypothetical protein